MRGPVSFCHKFSSGSVAGVGTPSYEDAGVRDQRDAISAVERFLGPTLQFPRDATVLTRFGHFAAVLKVAPELGIAISTDSAGSKTMIASALDRYDTIGFDCMAMNVNDIICIGARPIALVDYLGVHTLEAERAAQTLEGLAAAAQEAGVAIPGGEVAQLPDLIGSDGTRPGDERAFDLVGTAIGVVHPDRLILGHDIRPGDAILGIASTGIHSNGLTLARKVLLDTGGYGLDENFKLFGRSLGEELLEPTAIYVRPVVELWDKGLETRGLVHITGDGLTNLCRLEADVTYRIDSLPECPRIFRLIQDTGAISDEEMYRVFNMGVGFVAIVPAEVAEDALRLIIGAGHRAQRIGTVEEGPRRVLLETAGLVGTLEEGESRFARATA